jgi:hydroxysqualene dehydroxylase
MRLAIVGAGWAGLAAAVEAVQRGHEVSLYEMGRQPGGRARRVGDEPPFFDNGQHILIGAYSETLRLMTLVGADPGRLLWRRPLTLAFADGRALTLPTGEPRLAFVRAVLGRLGWRWRERWRLLIVAAGWARSGFRCDEALSVAELARELPECVRADLIEPLCIAALNTPVAQASASVFLRVLKDALFAGQGSADLLLPRVDLSVLWPDAAVRWLAQRGASLRWGARVMALEAQPAGGWRIDGPPCDGVVLAASAVEAARLAQEHAPHWADAARALRHEPIVTVVLRNPGARLPQPMLALRHGTHAPAQFVFDLSRLRGLDDLFAFVVSGAGEWVARGLPATVEATIAQARSELAAHAPGPWSEVRSLVEKRATFLCTPGLARPPATIAPGLMAAGDYIAGPYPATLEGAVRSGVAAVRALEAELNGARTALPAARR